MAGTPKNSSLVWCFSFWGYFQLPAGPMISGGFFQMHKHNLRPCRLKLKLKMPQKPPETLDLDDYSHGRYKWRYPPSSRWCSQLPVWWEMLLTPRRVVIWLILFSRELSGTPDGTPSHPYYSLIPFPFPNPLVRMGMVWVPLMGSLETSLVSTKVLHDAFTRSVSNSCSLLLRGTTFQQIAATHLIVTRVCAVYKITCIYIRIHTATYVFTYTLRKK